MQTRVIIFVCCLYAAGCGKKQSQPSVVVTPNPIPATTPESLPKIPVGKDTTFVDGPLDKNGYVDYVAALNERMSKGVTKDNNAVVLLWQAIGPKPEIAEMQEYFKILGMDAPDEQSVFFVDLESFLKDEIKVDQQQSNTIRIHAREFARKP